MWNLKYLPGRAWLALCCNPASQQTLWQSLTCHNPRKYGTFIKTKITFTMSTYSMYTSCVGYLGSYQAHVFDHVWLHHVGYQLGVTWRTDERGAAVRWSGLLGSCWDLEFDLDKKYPLFKKRVHIIFIGSGTKMRMSRFMLGWTAPLMCEPDYSASLKLKRTQQHWISFSIKTCTITSKSELVRSYLVVCKCLVNIRSPVAS